MLSDNGIAIRKEILVIPMLTSSELYLAQGAIVALRLSVTSMCSFHAFYHDVPSFFDSLSLGGGEGGQFTGTNLNV